MGESVADPIVLCGDCSHDKPPPSPISPLDPSEEFSSPTIASSETLSTASHTNPNNSDSDLLETHASHETSPMITNPSLTGALLEHSDVTPHDTSSPDSAPDTQTLSNKSF